MYKKGSGRQRVLMAKIAKKSDLYVTFTKRRDGLFKKANELCTLTGAKVAILINSPGNRMYSFGQPDVTPIIDRFLFEENTKTSEVSDPIQQFVEAYQKKNTSDLNKQLSQILHELEIEKKKGTEFKRMNKLANNQRRTWSELVAFKASLEELKRKVSVEKKIADSLQLSSLPPPPPPAIELPPLPPTYYESRSANFNGYFPQPLNFNVPHVENNFSGRMNVAGVNGNEFLRG